MNASDLQQNVFIFSVSAQTQITRTQTEVRTETSSSDRSLQLKISELLAMLEQRQTTITTQEEVSLTQGEADLANLNKTTPKKARIFKYKPDSQAAK